MQEKGKRKATFEDAFTDFELDDDFELNEAESKELDRLESPQKPANGKDKCNHQCKDKTKYSISSLLLNFDRCRHLCSKEGKGSNKTKSGASRSKSKKSTISPPSKVLKDAREIRIGDRTPAPKKHRTSDAPAEVLKFTERKVQSEGPIRGAVEMVATHRRATWNANDDLGLDSDDDLPLPKDLLAKWRSKESLVCPSTSVSNQAFAGIVQAGEQAKEMALDETGYFLQSKGKEGDVLVGYYSFSADDVMENIEIVP